MPFNKRVLVVGTTADYIDWIERHYPENALFLTAPEVRAGASEPKPPSDSEIVCALSDYRRPRAALAVHLAVNRIQLGGVVSYDCESMVLAADLARRYHLPYPSEQAVNNCRNKFRTKSLWQASSLNSPACKRVRTADEAVAFMRELEKPCVLKPLSGSGSELIFNCTDEAACRQNFAKIQQGLHQRANHPLYQPFLPEAQIVLAEEFVSGEEYSCDFIIDKGRVDIIRLTRKIPSRNGHFGTTLGYLLLPDMQSVVDPAALEDTLYRSAKALGLKRAVCMLDFMVRDGRIYLLELAPRPGGDCLPALLRIGLDLDIIGLSMDFSRRKQVRLPVTANSHNLVGLRLLASESGHLKKVDLGRIGKDERVRDICITRQPGHRIEMPPEDYDSWCLGHIIFAPDSSSDPEEQCRQLRSQLTVEVQ